MSSYPASRPMARDLGAVRARGGPALYVPLALIAACSASAKPTAPPADPAPQGYGYEFAVDTAEQVAASPGGKTYTLPTGPGGRLFPESIQTVVRGHFGSVLSCYEDGRKRDPNLKGKVIVKFVIGEDGNTKEAADAGSTLPDRDVVGCVVVSSASASIASLVAATSPWSTRSSSGPSPQRSLRSWVLC